MTPETPDELREMARVHFAFGGEPSLGYKLLAAADAWERALKIVEARPSDPYPDEDMDLSPEAHEWVQEIWRMARIHQAEAIRLRKRLEEAREAVKELSAPEDPAFGIHLCCGTHEDWMLSKHIEGCPWTRLLAALAAPKEG